mmetsp:Transcript_8434/g.21651  ORF Transcript_8434/g.21651 Transcript_8434/m.21651 type:complete len:277 (+) Transcript_8434:416-1246(+)
MFRHGENWNFCTACECHCQATKERASSVVIDEQKEVDVLRRHEAACKAHGHASPKHRSQSGSRSSHKVALIEIVVHVIDWGIQQTLALLHVHIRVILHLSALLLCVISCLEFSADGGADDASVRKPNCGHSRCQQRTHEAKSHWYVGPRYHTFHVVQAWVHSWNHRHAVVCERFLRLSAARVHSQTHERCGDCPAYRPPQSFPSIVVSDSSGSFDHVHSRRVAKAHTSPTGRLCRRNEQRRHSRRFRGTADGRHGNPRDDDDECTHHRRYDDGRDV